MHPKTFQNVEGCYLSQLRYFGNIEMRKRLFFLLKCAICLYSIKLKEPSISTEDLSDVLSLWPVCQKLTIQILNFSDTFSLLGERW